MGFMSNVKLGRALLVLLALVVGLVLLMPAVRSSSTIEPAAAMTVTVALDKAAYLSGDTAKANAIVYRTPAPANYTYTWTVRDTFFRLLNTTAGGASYPYAIPLNYTGWINVDVWSMTDKASWPPVERRPAWSWPSCPSDSTTGNSTRARRSPRPMRSRPT